MDQIEQTELTDDTADHYLLAADRLTLVVFYSQTCGNCKQARAILPTLTLPVAQIAWVDAGRNAGLVTRYEVFHLPAMHVVRDGVFYGAVDALLTEWDLTQQIRLALNNYPTELP